ncbi:MAG: TonB-dependent receptor [Phascolarctobacterium sp.]|nr:TonB-dependent receptor [Phascolarctobacterium sp.]
MNLQKNALTLLSIFCLGVVPTGVYAGAEKASFQLDEYVVTATRSILDKKEVPQSVEVITKERMEKLGATSVRDALKYASNIYVADGNGGHGDKLTLRGGSFNDVLVLLNGRRIVGENLYAVERDSGNARVLDRFNLSNVERIEIVRGQAGALYGSDAQAGVINIITKKSAEPSFVAGVNSGSRQMNNYYHWDSGKQGKVSAVVDVSFNKLRNFDSKAKGFSYGPGQSYSLDLDYEMDEANRLNLYLDYTKQKHDFEAITESRGMSLSWNNHREYERKLASLTYDGEQGKHTYSVTASYGELESVHNEKEFYFTGGRPAVIPKLYQRKHKQWNVEARDSIQLAENNKLTFGGEVRSVDGGAFVANGKDKTDQYALYLQEEVYVNDRLLVIPSVRYDHHDSFGGQISPNLGATYFFSENSRLKANYGKAYRAPSVDELYGAFDHMGMFTFYGNPNLKPEETTGWELSYEQEFSDKAKAKLTYFANEKENAITYKDIQSFGGMLPDKQFVNIDEASAKGVEFAYEQDLGAGFTLLLDYAYLDAKNEVTDVRLEYSARNTYTAKLLWTEEKVNPWSVTLSNRWYSDYCYDGKDYSINTFNVAVNKKWGNCYRAFIALDNLFDKENENINAYGRLWRAGVELTF